MLLVLVLAISPLAQPDGLVPSGRGSAAQDGPGVDGPPLRARPMDALPPPMATGFVENVGQLPDPDVMYYARGSRLSVGFSSHSVLFTMREAASVGPGAIDAPMGTAGPVGPHLAREVVTYTMWFEGGGHVRPVGRGALGHLTNYFVGDDPDRWVTGARSFSEVLYTGVYDGVDAMFYQRNGTLKYDLIVAPGADVDGIILHYEGIEGLAVDGATGELLIRTRLGTVNDARPLVLQEAAGIVGGLPGDFERIDGHRARFVLPDGIARDRPMTIDPGIVFSTFLGGSDTEWGRAVDVQSDGTIVVGGDTTSHDFPVPRDAGSYDRNGSGQGSYDIFVARLDPTGSRLLSATYFGGIDIDMCRAMELGPDGSVYVLGWTYSKDIPKKDPIIDQYMGDLDLVLARFSADCSRLLYSSYLGGKGNDWCLAMTLWKDGSVFLGGCTNSSDFPVTDGAYCSTYEQNRTDNDFFVAKINGSLAALDFCTYIGGSGIEGNVGQYHCMYVTPSGQPVLFGGTTSSDIPMTSGAHRSVKTTNESDTDAAAFVLDATGSRILHATYFGGNRTELAYAVELGPDGEVYIAGETLSADLEVTQDAICATLGNASDGYLAVLDPSLEEVIYCTYVGGNGSDAIAALAWGPNKRTLYAMLVTKSGDIRTTQGAFDSRRRDSNDFFNDIAVMGFDAVNRSVVYCTYFGGGGDEYDSRTYRDIRAAPDGTFLLVGVTTSPDLPITAGAFCDTYNKGFMAFVWRLDPRPCPPPSAPKGLDALGLDEAVSLHWDRLPRSLVFEGARAECQRLYRGTARENITFYRQLNWSEADFKDLNLTNGVRYYYELRTVTNAGEGAPAAVTARPMHLPTEPLDLSLETGNRTIVLRWSAPADIGGELLGYRIYRGEAPASLTVIATVGNGTNYEDAGVDCRRTYWYAVSAFNEKGEGMRGSTQYMMPQGPPSAVEDVLALASDGRVDLGWQAPANDGGYDVLGYRVYKGASEGDLARLAQLGKDARTHTDLDVVNAHEYWYAVTAYSMYGEGTAAPLRAVPFTIPGRPLNLTAVAGDARAALSWDPPLLNGGRPVSGYVVHYGKSRDSLGLTWTVGNVTSSMVTMLRNGDAYYFTVAAVNEAGEGLASDYATTVPMGPPAPPTDLTVHCARGGMQLTWVAPADLGGAESVSFRVYRAVEGEAPVIVAEHSTALQHLDGDVAAGTAYEYWVTAVTPEGREGGASNVVAIVARTAPGPTAGLGAAIVAPDQVDLSWGAPTEDGGSTVTGYAVFRGTDPSRLESIARLGTVLAYADCYVQNGMTYYYSVRAVNEFGEGAAGALVNATPLGLPLPPQSLRARVEGDRVVLSWVPSTGLGRAPVTGYVVYRGTSRGALEHLDEVGNATTFTDMSVERGRTYHYAVVALSELGEGERAAPVEASLPEVIGPMVLAIIVVAVVAVAAAAVARARTARAAAAKRRVSPAEGEVVAYVDGGGGPPAGAVAAGPGGERGTYIVEEVFVVSRDGHLMADCARDYCRTVDADLMSGLLIAIQGLIQDGLRRDETLESIKYGDSLIFITSGEAVHLAVVLYGAPDDELCDALDATIETIEATYAGVLEAWTGDPAVTTGIEGLVQPLVRRTEHLRREGLSLPHAAEGVCALTAIDFHRGYVRLKVAVVNGTDEVVTDTTIDVLYNPDMLRLERVEPATLRRRGDRVSMGTIKPGERATVAILFDPQICQGTHIDGVLNYYDTRGAAHSVQMKRRTADVVCPIFFTRDQANTAMLRRLIRERLRQSDLRVLHYPAPVAPQDMLRMAKSALGGEGVQLVREYIAGGPPLEAEVWYYGETKVKGYQMVMRLGVLEERRVLEVFAASTEMAPVTGLLAEFRRAVDRAIRERYGTTDKVEPASDEELLRTLRGRELLIDAEEGTAQGGAKEGAA